MRTNRPALTPGRLALVAVGAALALGGCVRQGGLEAREAPAPVLTPSAEWQRSVEPETYRRRVGELTRAIERLRRETGAGWIGRQDDVTGYLRELRGGHFFGGDDPEGVVGALFDGYGPALFGVDAAELSFREEGEPDEAGLQVVRGTQRRGDVPVLDGALVATVKTGTPPRLTSLRGRVFPDIEAAEEPRLSAGRAARIAEEASGGRRDRPPRLVIVPLAGGGTLAWEVEISGATELGEELGTAIYYIDAESGEIVSIRPGGEDGGLLRLVSRSAGALRAQADGDSVEVSGTGPIGEQLTATATVNEDGSISLVDTTTGIYDPGTGAGAVSVHDASGLTDDTSDQLPGPVMQSDTPDVADPEALAALAYTRLVHDYYRDTHGRNSWDNQGGSYIGSVHFGGPEFCNAYFDGAQMVYGVPCEREGVRHVTTFVDVDVVGHEITHGVDSTSSNLNYVAQSGALDES
ncbi:MAG: hypothetical protein M3245_06300, partial [Actinomycetota bacterium]|nr:hypothetical protein [Actinomycetota bacterium]